MAGCCRAITDQLLAVEATKKRLSGSRRSSEELAHAVEAHLDTCRRVLGTYRVSRSLTSQFRQQIEPELANVWTSEELKAYALQLQRFSGTLKKTLTRWKQQYCKEALSA